MIPRRIFVAGIAPVMTAPRSGEAQQASKVYRVGILGNSPPGTPGSHLWGEFRRSESPGGRSLLRGLTSESAMGRQGTDLSVFAIM